MFTVITEGNSVSSTKEPIVYTINDHYIIICEDGMVCAKKGNPITWPTDATNGLQAIVDIKAGTLRFGWGPRVQTEFVVSEYVGPVHVLDHISSWPDTALATPVAPDGWGWKYLNYGWVLVNDKEGVEFHEGHWLRNHHENKKKHADVSVQVGTKHDQGKPILGAVPPHAELAVGRVLTFGSNKYARGNWDKVEDHENRYMDAALRHLNAHRRGELTDSESGESHLAHAACCILFMLDKQERS